MPRGGRRQGSGRKSRQPLDSEVVAVFQPTIIEGGKPEMTSVRPPEDLPSNQHDFWRRYAPMAMRARTLAPQTEAAFRLLCEVESELRATKAQIDKDGRTYIKVTVDGAGQEHEELRAHPLTSAYRQLAQRVEMLMARFSLAPFGKPVTPKTEKATHWLDSLTG